MKKNCQTKIAAVSLKKNKTEVLVYHCIFYFLTNVLKHNLCKSSLLNSLPSKWRHFKHKDISQTLHNSPCA